MWFGWLRSSKKEIEQLKILRQIIDGVQPEGHATDREQQPDHIDLAIYEQPAPTEGQHRAKEQAHWRWQRYTEEGRDRLARITLLISVLALLAAGLSFCENHKQADVAQKAFEAGVRPWVYAIGNPGNHNFTYDAKDGTTTFILLLKIKGIGQVPAQHVFGAGSFLPYEPNMEGKLAAQKASCDKYILWYKGRKKSGILFPDQTIFPGQEGIVMALISNGETPFQGVDVNTIIAPLLVGCIFYTDQTGEFHRTGFIYQLWRKDPAISGERGFALREQPIPTNELVLAADELGAGPAD